MTDLAALRQEYSRAGLSESDLAPTWHEQLDRWLADAAPVRELNAMVVSTVSDEGRPSSRNVLLKGADARGLVFFTNLGSRKATEALGQSWVALCLPWVDLERQVLVEGTVSQVSRAESEAYWVTRPRDSQLGAWASRQSTVVTRAELEARMAAAEERFPSAVPLPEFWGGLRVAPVTVEFWQGRQSRLHDRLRYRLNGKAWVVERLSP
ncbi:MAG: pyridoxamine 5-phosphate oxidase [Frankiales bacterium]|nr:pyridoxamine 5-phosphate oxidase [Frankiales bacterium]